MSLFETIFETISNAITSVDWDGIFASISTAIETVMTTLQTLRAVFYEVLGAITTQIDVFWGIVGPVWTQFVGVLQQAYTQLAPLGAVFTQAFGDIATQGQGMAPIGEILGNVAKAILNVVGVLVQVLVPIIKFVFPLMVEYIQNVITMYMNLYNAINYVFSGKLQNDIVAWWTSTVASITSVINELIGKARQIGTDIVNGIANGIRGAGNALRDAFALTIGDAISFAKRILGIASPSKLFADVIGRPIGQGIAAGIVASAPSIAGALGGTIGAATAAPTFTVGSDGRLTVAGSATITPGWASITGTPTTTLRAR